MNLFLNINVLGSLCYFSAHEGIWEQVRDIQGQEQEMFRPETIIASLIALKMQRLQTKELAASVFILDVMEN